MIRTFFNQNEILGTLWMELANLHLHTDGVADQFDKIEANLRQAAQLQRELLPAQLPKASGIEFNVLFRPAGYVSGDIYDVIQLDDEHIGFFLADAVGHGVSAALMTVFIRSCLAMCGIDTTYSDCHDTTVDHTGAASRIIPPNQALAWLNREIIDDQTGQIHTATAVYGLINTRTHQVQIARAGHPFPIVLHDNGTTSSVRPDGALLGVFPGELFELAQLQLGPGDRLLLFSDGIELAFPELAEACVNHEQLEDDCPYGLQEMARGSVDDVINRFANSLDIPSGSLHPPDDVTILLLGINEPAASDPVTAQTQPDEVFAA